MRIKNFIRHQVAPLLAMLLVLGSFRSAIADWNIVPTGSMNPTILEGDRIFVNKLAYGLRVPFTELEVAHWSSPRRGEVVVFHSPANGERLVKRVVGMPGDSVQLVNNVLLLNGTSASYTLLPGSTPPGTQLPHTFASERMPDGATHVVMATPRLPAMRNFGPLRVP